MPALRQMPAADVPNKASWPKRDEFRGRRAAQSTSCLRMHARRSAGIRSLRRVGLESQLISIPRFLCSTFDIAFFVPSSNLSYEGKAIGTSHIDVEFTTHTDITRGPTLSTPLGRSSTCTPRTTRLPLRFCSLFRDPRFRQVPQG